MSWGNSIHHLIHLYCFWMFFFLSSPIQTMFTLRCTALNANTLVFMESMTQSVNYHAYPVLLCLFHSCTTLLNGLQEPCAGICTWYFLMLYNAVKLWGIKNSLTVLHSCVPTWLKQQVSLGQALMCFFAVMMTANCSGPALPAWPVSEETRKRGRTSKAIRGFYF